MRKLILALTLMLSVVAVQAANYGINVGGVEVSTSNYYNVTGGQIKRGTVSYNPSTNTLTLNNVDISRTGSLPARSDILSYFLALALMLHHGCRARCSE